MRQLHKVLRENHHLRHGGRMQYGLFLKGIGLTLEQALEFWKKEFIKGKVDADKFDKGYAYSIRHNYGKEGKRTDYTPYSCMKIIMSNPPSQGDYHGCPFRHSDPELLKQKLQSYKVPPSGVTQILELVKGMHYQLACQKYFELTHDVSNYLQFLCPTLAILCFIFHFNNCFRNSLHLYIDDIHIVNIARCRKSLCFLPKIVNSVNLFKCFHLDIYTQMLNVFQAI
uniref:DNA primase large subunit C-terminal domain-containing protein n=1 Tax=Meleagris gallopavo TaxID=9103 RepID=G1NM85_MELGA